jgi:cellobiose transport system substrate-binding protein
MGFAHLDSGRRGDNSHLLIEEARMWVARAGTRKLRIAAGGLLAASLVAGCSFGPSQPVFKRVGPLITLHVGVYGDPGYEQSGLYTEYEHLHPNIKIVQDGTAQQASYWAATTAGLKSGHSADDVQAVPVADISEVTGPLSGDFVPLNTIGGVSAGSNTFADDWLPWVGQQAMSAAGTTYALGAEIGPIAICYRPDLLAEAGLPTKPAVLARDWSTWPGYLSLGRLFKTRIPRGPAFTDSVTSLYNAIAGQAKEQYYSQSGSLVVSSNPVIKTAWDTAVQAASEGLSAKLGPQSAAWNRGVTRGSFATVICPAWMLHQITDLSGPLGAGQWNVAAAPGGAGNSGGFYLAIPKTSTHQQAAFQLADFLAGEQAGIDLFRTQGDFPANFAAVTAVNTITNGYFGGAHVGAIFGQSADRTPATILGPASDAISAEVDSSLSQVEAGRMASASAWQAALRQAAAAASQAAAH